MRIIEIIREVESVVPRRLLYRCGEDYECREELFKMIREMYCIETRDPRYC